MITVGPKHGAPAVPEGFWRWNFVSFLDMGTANHARSPQTTLPLQSGIISGGGGVQIIGT